MAKPKLDPPAATLPAPGASTAPWRQSLLCAAIALLVRVIYLLESGANPFRLQLDLDIGVYHAWAQAILAGTQLAPGPFLQAPLFPYFLAGCYALFGADPAAVFWLQAVIGAVTVLIATRIAGRLFGSVGALATGLLLALYRPAIFYTAILLVPTIATCLLAAAILAAPRRPLLAGIFAGLTGLAHPIVLPGALIAAFGFTSRRRALLLLLMGFIIALLPTTIYNFVQSGRFIPISANTGINFYIGNTQTANGFYIPPTGMRGDEDPVGIREASRRCGDSLTATEASSYWLNQGLNAWRSEPLTRTALYFKKLYSTLSAYEIPQIESYAFEQRYSTILRLPFFPSWIVLLTLAAAAMAGAWRDRRLRCLLLATAASSSLIALFFVTARFRLPLSLFLALAAGGGISRLLNRLRHRPLPSPRQALPVLLTGLVTLLIFSPNWRDVAQEQSFGSYYFRLGVFAEREGQIEVAMDHYREALTADSLYARAAINLGILTARNGDLLTAEPLLRRGITLDPRSARGLLALGQLRQLQDDLTGACDLYQRALAADYSFLRALEFLATALYLAGDLTESASRCRELIEKAGHQSPLIRRCQFIQTRLSEREGHQLLQHFSPSLAKADLTFAAGNAPGAARAYQDLLATDPRNPIALLELTRILISLNQTDRANRFLERFIAAGGPAELATPLQNGGNRP